MSKMYKVEDVVRIARRYNNAKRSYLLVNPLQGKHIPAKPIEVLKMMKALGDKVAEKYSEARLVIGFAETATAIGAMVANSLSDDCIYIHTTREEVKPCIEFLEEHSHAPQQRLYCADLNDYFAGTSTIIFVDDEISTGKTLINMIRQLKSAYPELNNKNLVAASIINRLTAENEELLKLEGIACEYLVKLPSDDFDVSDIEVKPAFTLPPSYNIPGNTAFIETTLPPNLRLGVKIGEYMRRLTDTVHNIYTLADSAGDYDSILIAGTEEFMLPAICIAERLESAGYDVRTHSTTRSPIGINTSKNYPIIEGYQLRSTYDINRTTYIYNLQYYDLIIFISDVTDWQDETVKDLITIVNEHGCQQVFFVGDKNV